MHRPLNTIMLYAQKQIETVARNIRTFTAVQISLTTESAASIRGTFKITVAFRCGDENLWGTIA